MNILFVVCIFLQIKKNVAFAYSETLIYGFFKKCHVITLYIGVIIVFIVSFSVVGGRRYNHIDALSFQLRHLLETIALY